MKRLLLTAAAVMAAVSTYAQGTINFTTFNFAPISSEVTGSAVVGANGIVAGIYWSLPGANNFQLVAGSTPAAVGAAVPGHVLGAPTVTINEIAPGAMVDVQIRAWESAYGNTYEAASTAGEMGGRGAQVGNSPTVTIMSGGGGMPPGPPASLNVPGMMGFEVTLVPEPSVIALGLVGAGALLLLRRRNK
jgi:hypothetical protein